MLGIFIGISIYLIIGYLVVKSFDSVSADGEILGALILLWPILVLGKYTKLGLLKIGCYHKSIEYIFTGLIVIAVLFLLLLYSKTLFGK